MVIDIEDEEASLDQEDKDCVDGPQQEGEVVDIGSVEGSKRKKFSRFGLSRPP